MTSTKRWTIAAPLMLAAAFAVGCGQGTSETDQRLAELEKQLADTKQQLADAGQQPPLAAQAQTPAQAAATPAAATQKPPAAVSPNLPGGPPASQKYVTAEQGQKAADQYAKDKAETERLVEQQKAVNAKQTEATVSLQQQVQRLEPREFTLPAGTALEVRTTSELSTARLSNGSVFEALLENDLRSDGVVLAKAGTRVTGVVVSSDPGGRVKGTASLTVGVRSILGIKGDAIAVTTDSYSVEAGSTVKKDAVRTGVLTGVGAAIGAIAGGGSGAAIGAGAGAAAGVGTNVATRGAAAVIPGETLMTFSLTAPVTVVLRP